MAGGLRDGGSFLNDFLPRSDSVSLLLITFVEEDDDRLKERRCWAEDATLVCCLAFSFSVASFIREEREEVDNLERERGLVVIEFSRLIFSSSLAFLEEADAVSNGLSVTTAVGWLCLAE